jgi:hypothetical protein
MLSALSELAKQLQKLITKGAFEEVISLKKNRGGSLGYGDIATTINGYHELGHGFLKWQQITYLLKTHNKIVNCGDVVGISVGDTLINCMFDSDILTLAYTTVDTTIVDAENLVESVIFDYLINAPIRNMGRQPKNWCHLTDKSKRIQSALAKAATKYKELIDKQNGNIRMAKDIQTINMEH